MAKALTIGGSDTSSGAGIQADLRIFSTLKVYGMSVITALTAQNTRSVSRIAVIGSGMVRAQIHAVLDDMGLPPRLEFGARFHDACLVIG